MEPLKDLRAEAAAHGEAPLVLDASTGTVIPLQAGDPGGAGSRRRAEDHRLPPEVAARLAEAVPPNTRRAWAFRWARFEAWCAQNGYAGPMPPTAAMLASYLDHLGHDQRLKVSTLEAHLGSLMAVTQSCIQLSRVLSFDNQDA